MIKFGSTRDLYAVEKSRHRQRHGTPSSLSSVSTKTELQPPKSICLDDLRALLPEVVGNSSFCSLEPPPEIDLDDLRDLLEPAGVVTRKDVGFQGKNLLGVGSITGKTTSGFRIWQNVVEKPSIPELTRSTQSLDEAGSPKIETNVRKPSSLKDVTKESGTKVKVVDKSEDADTKLDGPEAFLKKLEELAEDDNLEKWIENLNLPKEFDLPQIREQIRVFLKDKCWEKDGGLRFKIMDSSLAKRLWFWFKDLSIAKQILVVIGLSLVVAAIGFLTIQLLAFIWPGVLGVATSGEAALTEIGVEAFKQRQEPAFHLLHLHAEQAKPMSYAWANQYILWKYCRNR